MFTGIVTDLGEVLEVEQRGDLRARWSTLALGGEGDVYVGLGF